MELAMTLTIATAFIMAVIGIAVVICMFILTRRIEDVYDYIDRLALGLLETSRKIEIIENNLKGKK